MPVHRMRGHRQRSAARQVPARKGVVVLMPAEQPRDARPSSERRLRHAPDVALHAARTDGRLMHEHHELHVLGTLGAFIPDPLLLLRVDHAVHAAIPFHEAEAAGVERAKGRLVGEVLAPQGAVVLADVRVVVADHVDARDVFPEPLRKNRVNRPELPFGVFGGHLRRGAMAETAVDLAHVAERGHERRLGLHCVPLRDVRGKAYMLLVGVDVARDGKPRRVRCIGIETDRAERGLPIAFCGAHGSRQKRRAEERRAAADKTPTRHQDRSVHFILSGR